MLRLVTGAAIIALVCAPCAMQAQAGARATQTVVVTPKVVATMGASKAKAKGPLGRHVGLSPRKGMVRTTPTGVGFSKVSVSEAKKIR
jgi:hypothetical protein